MPTKKADPLTRSGLKFSGYNKPRRTPGASKEYAVLARESGKTKLVRFGDPKLSVKSDQPKRKKSYCSRSAGLPGDKGSKLTANYWSRKRWKC